MRGRVKKEKPPTQSEIDNDRKKSVMYNKLLDIVFTCRANGSLNETALDLTSKVLKTNPDVYTVWNFRKEILLSMHKESLGLSSDVPEEKIAREISQEVVTKELSLSTEAIKKNSKSYGAWQHRVWILDRFEVDVNTELALCKEFLTFDQRNFHCWNYRRYLVKMASVPHAAEFEYSTEKISENFSNYSALHHRSIYIKSLVSESNTQEENQSIFETEFSIVENAIFTEPDDQSAWWYYHFLLKFAVQSLSLESIWFTTELHRHLEVLNSLLEVEPSCKWCMVAKLFLITEILAVGADTNEVSNVLKQERNMTIETLCELDPAHLNRYLYLQRNYKSDNCASAPSS